MKADLCAELGLLNRNVVEMIRLFECAMDAGIWTRQGAARHEARLDVLRTKLHADFRELIALRERANGLQLSAEIAHPCTTRCVCMQCMESGKSDETQSVVGIVRIKSESTR